MNDFARGRERLKEVNDSKPMLTRLSGPSGPLRWRRRTGPLPLPLKCLASQDSSRTSTSSSCRSSCSGDGSRPSSDAGSFSRS
jgi:hypothetical protein